MDINYKLTADGKELDVNRYQFKFLSIGYQMNSYPTFSLTLKKILSPSDETSNDTKYDFLKYKNFDIDIKSEQFNFKSKLGVNNVFVKTLNSIVFQGYLCDSKMFSESNSTYLGNTIKDAIGTLGFKQELSIGNVSRDFFQFDETAINCLNSLLLSSGEKISYFITENKISTKRLESLYRDTSEKAIRVQFEAIQYDPMFDIGDKVTDTKVDIKSEELESEGFINISSQYASCLTNLHNDSVIRNVVSNLVYLQGYNLELTIPDSQVGKYEDGSPIELGDVVTLPYVDLPVLRYLITGVDKIYSQTGLTVKLKLQTLRLS